MAPKPPRDLGNVPFSLTVDHAPRDAAERGPARPMEAGGVLSALQGVHAGVYRGKWTLAFGDVPLKLKTHVDVSAIEELFVFLIELVDGGFGEWTLQDKDELLVIEATARGVDVGLEFGDGEGGPGRFRRVRFPATAQVRLRPLVEDCARAIRRMVLEAGVAHEEFGARADVDELTADLDALVEAVSAMPREWARRDKALPVVW